MNRRFCLFDSGCLVYGVVSLRYSDDPADQSGHTTGIHGRHLVLSDAQMGQVDGSHRLGRRSHADLLLFVSVLGRSHHFGQLQSIPQRLLQVNHF